MTLAFHLVILLVNSIIANVAGWGTASLGLNRYRNVLEFQSQSSLALAMSKSEEEQERKVKVLGVCGGIGSGKSQACKLLVSELGCMTHIDADTTAHVVYEPGSKALEEIAELFGSDILLENGQIDRKKLGSIVFADKAAMSQLEHFVWPHVKTVIQQRIQELRSNSANNDKIPVIVLEAAMLLDAEWDDLLDGLWIVTTPPEMALDRLVSNRDLSTEEAQKRMDAQATRRGVGNLAEEVENGVVTCVIENKGSIEDLTTSLEEALCDPTAWTNPPVIN
mmetsp:Transcript_11903/g.16899  ORF Transcript_11903/g.16899 Transcript_11903/m.16899 type:complete len:279 (-) Transcript_11903:1531-2367(-)